MILINHAVVVIEVHKIGFKHENEDMFPMGFTGAIIRVSAFHV